MNEYVDIFDEAFNYLGSEEKDLVHEKGLWHQTFHCWIFRREGDRTYVLFQRRSVNKKDSPLLYDISAAGHLQKGECKEHGVREIKEELGVDVVASDLIYLGIRVSEYRYKNIYNREFNQVFLWESPYTLEDYTMQESELDTLIEMELEDGFKLFSGEKEYVDCHGIVMQNGKKIAQDIRITRDKFLKRVDLYYLRVLIMVERYVDGKSYICI